MNAQAQLHAVRPDRSTGTSTHDVGAKPVPNAVEVRGLTKRFIGPQGPVLVLDDVSLDIRASERLVLLGPSGCGKTTLLRCIAGLETPDAGEIIIGGKVVFCSRRGISVPPEHRGLSMVFQSYALWPHKTAFDNVAYPLQNRKVAKDEITQRVNDVLTLVGCGGLGSRYPSQLSGGQQQRIALARALAGSESLVLFDEPLSNVDAKVRETLRIELIALQKRLSFAAIYVTHDQVEATAIAHRLAVMQAGRFAQIDTPQKIYEEPATGYVAEFTGTSNHLSGRVVAHAQGRIVVSTPIGILSSLASAPCEIGQDVNVLLRPEHIQLHTEMQAAGNCWRTSIESRMFQGAQTEYAIKGPDGYLLVRGSGDQPLEETREDAEVWASVQAPHVKVFPASTT